jgi:predicted outer membrane lipoprotein
MDHGRNQSSTQHEGHLRCTGIPSSLATVSRQSRPGAVAELTPAFLYPQRSHAAGIDGASNFAAAKCALGANASRAMDGMDCRLIDRRTGAGWLATDPAPVAFFTPDKNPHVTGFSCTSAGAMDASRRPRALKTHWPNRARAISPVAHAACGKECTCGATASRGKVQIMDSKHWIAIAAFVVSLILVLCLGATQAAIAVGSAVIVAGALINGIAKENAAAKSNNAGGTPAPQKTVGGNGSTSSPSMNALGWALIPLLALLVGVGLVGGCAPLSNVLSFLTPTGKVYPPTTQGTNEKLADEMEAGYGDFVIGTQLAAAFGIINPAKYAVVQSAEILAKRLIDAAEAAAYADDADAVAKLNAAEDALVELRGVKTDAITASSITTDAATRNAAHVHAANTVARLRAVKP